MKFYEFYESILFTLARHEAAMNLIFKLKNLFNQALSLSDSINKIIAETCKILDCDRATIFLLDKKSNMLWSKSAKGSKNTIYCPIGKGVVGFVA